MLRQQIITVTLQQIDCEEIGGARMPGDDSQAYRKYCFVNIRRNNGCGLRGLFQQEIPLVPKAPVP